jgi:branched-chain amino acid transport system permease protein
MGRLGAGGSLLGVLLAVVLAGGAGAVVALPALRLKDLYLALTTLAFAVFGEWAFNQRWLLGQGGILSVPRLHLPGIAIRSERSQLVLAAVAFAAVGLVVLAIRRGPFGRRLAAMADSQLACATLGLNLVQTRTAAFAISAGMAGLAGALFGGLRTSVSSSDFVMLQSLFIYLAATIGGITTVMGAFLGGVFLIILPELAKHLHISNFQSFGIAFAAVGLADEPNGVAGNIATAGGLIRASLGNGRRRREERRSQPPLRPERAEPVVTGT